MVFKFMKSIGGKSARSMELTGLRRSELGGDSVVKASVETIGVLNASWTEEPLFLDRVALMVELESLVGDSTFWFPAVI